MYRKFAALGGALVGFSILFLFLGLDPLVRFGVKDQTALKKNSEIRGIYLKIPFPLYFNVYFFNVTNPQDVQKGAKPVLKEIGPYSYDEYVEKIQVTDNESDDTLTYYPYTTFKFNKEKSGKLSDDDYVTILNPLLMGIINVVIEDSPALLSIVSQAVNPLFRNPQSIYITAKVKDILFDGLEVYCDGNEFAAKAVCAQLKTQMPNVQESKKNVYLVSLFGSRNATMGKSVKVKRGINYYKDLGRVMEFDGRTKLDLWSTEECNNFKGTDGWIIPPLLSQDEDIWFFSAEMCRNVNAYYVTDDTLKSLNVRRYEADLGDATNNDKDKCYCSERGCLKKGLFSMKKCLGIPVIATLPHFLYADDSYLTQIKGLNPNKSDHCIYLMLEQTTSTPIQAVRRMQLNFMVAPNDKVPIMKNLSTSLHPVLWIEDGVDLEGPILKKVQTIFFMLKITKALRWVMLLAGFGVLGYACFVYMKNNRSLKISHIHEPSPTTKKSVKSISGEVDAMRSNNGKNHRVIGHSVLTGNEFARYKNS